MMMSCCGTLLGAQPLGTRDSVPIPGSVQAMQLAFIPGGELVLTQPSGTPVRVALSPFWMGIYEVRYAEYNLFQFRQNDSDASAWQGGTFRADAIARPTRQYVDLTFGMGTKGGVPAVSMTQQAALHFCYWLYQKTGQFFRLPTEAEWEYACRAGGSGPLPLGVNANALDQHAWHYDNSFEKYHPVGEKQPNAWGFFDMLGNVAEWTLDAHAPVYAEKIADQPLDPQLPPTSRYGRTVKGGSFDDNPSDCTCAQRLASTAGWQKRDPQIPKSKWWNTDSAFVGFRVVRPVNQPSAAEVVAFFEKMIVD